MSNGTMNVYERLFKLFVKIGMMILDKTRIGEQVADWLQRIVDKPDFVSILDQLPSASVSTEPVGGWAAEWTRFYREVFGLSVDFAGIPLPAEQPGFGWMVYVAEGLTLNQAWAKCRDRFPSSSDYGDDLDRAVPKNDRAFTTAYAKRFRNRVEADEELKNTSANTMAQREINGITLMERMLLELWYHWKTGGGHMDLTTVTLCAGSRYTGGGVPSARWHGGQFRLYCYDPDDAHGYLRARSAV